MFHSPFNLMAVFLLYRDFSHACKVSSVITKDGPKPITVGELPISIQGLIQTIKSFERVTIEAAITGHYDTALLALSINPLIGSDKVAKQILDEMLEAHKAYLPNFFENEIKTISTR